MNKIRELRKANGYTLKQLGVLIGVGESTVSQYENEKRQPDNATLIKLASIFGVSVDYLLGVDDKPTEERQSPSATSGLTERERALLDLFSRVPADKQNLVVQMIRAALETQQ